MPLLVTEGVVEEFANSIQTRGSVRFIHLLCNGKNFPEQVVQQFPQTSMQITTNPTGQQSPKESRKK